MDNAKIRQNLAYCYAASGNYYTLFIFIRWHECSLRSKVIKNQKTSRRLGFSFSRDRFELSQVVISPGLLGNWHLIFLLIFFFFRVIQ